MINRDQQIIRAFDLTLSIVGLTLLSPLFVIITLLGYFDTGSPLFVQTRVGKGLKPFKLIKFRTMRRGTQSVATHLAPKSSVTVLGSFLRKTKLDELPQLLNVLRGEMSLVGPRPCLPEQRELIEERNSREVYGVLPGITGLAQVNNIDMSRPKTLSEFDQRMMLEMSLLNYFKYLIQTVVGRGRGDNIS